VRLILTSGGIPQREDHVSKTLKAHGGIKQQLALGDQTGPPFWRCLSRHALVVAGESGCTPGLRAVL